MRPSRLYLFARLFSVAVFWTLSTFSESRAQEVNHDHSFFHLYFVPHDALQIQFPEDAIYIGNAILLDESGYFLTSRHNMKGAGYYFVRSAMRNWGENSKIIKVDVVAEGRNLSIQNDWALTFASKTSPANEFKWQPVSHESDTGRLEALYSNVIPITPRAEDSSFSKPRLGSPEIWAGMPDGSFGVKHIVITDITSDLRTKSLESIYKGYSGSALVDGRNSSVHGIVSRSVPEFNTLGKTTLGESVSRRMQCIMHAINLSLITVESTDAHKESLSTLKEAVEVWLESDSSNELIELTQEVLNLVDLKTRVDCGFVEADSRKNQSIVDIQNLGDTIEGKSKSLKNMAVHNAHVWAAIWQVLLRDITTTRFVTFADRTCSKAYFEQAHQTWTPECNPAESHNERNLVFVLANTVFEHSKHNYQSQQSSELTFGESRKYRQIISQLTHDIDNINQLGDEEDYTLQTDLIRLNRYLSQDKATVNWITLHALAIQLNTIRIAQPTLFHRVFYEQDGIFKGVTSPLDSLLHSISSILISYGLKGMVLEYDDWRLSKLQFHKTNPSEFNGSINMVPSNTVSLQARPTEYAGLRAIAEAELIGELSSNEFEVTDRVRRLLILTEYYKNQPLISQSE